MCVTLVDCPFSIDKKIFTRIYTRKYQFHSHSPQCHDSTQSEEASHFKEDEPAMSLSLLSNESSWALCHKTFLFSSEHFHHCEQINSPVRHPSCGKRSHENKVGPCGNKPRNMGTTFGEELVQFVKKQPPHTLIVVKIDNWLLQSYSQWEHEEIHTMLGVGRTFTKNRPIPS